MPATTSSPLEKEFRYFLDHRAELLEKYRGKVVVIRDEKVIGSYNDELSAIDATKQKFEVGTFLVQKVEADEESYTQTFHSRVSF